MTDQERQGDKTSKIPITSADLSQAKKTQEVSTMLAALSQTKKELEQLKEELEQLKEEIKQLKKESTDSALRWLTSEILKQLVKYVIQAFAGLVFFGVFVVTSIVIELIARIAGQFGILIRIVGWSISAGGAICCIALVVRNTIDFIKFLCKGPPQGKSRQEDAGEGRVE